jgi:uncharacterized protein (UPF0303 family)
MTTTGGFSSSQLLAQEIYLTLPYCEISDAIEIGDIAKSIGLKNKLKIAIEVRILDWTVYHISLPGSKPENDWWLSRKARVVNFKHHSTMHERVYAEERNADWFNENGVSEEFYAIHGGGFPLITKKNGFVGALVISGLPQVEDHLLGVQVLTQFLARNGEKF